MSHSHTQCRAYGSSQGQSHSEAKPKCLPGKRLNNKGQCCAVIVPRVATSGCGHPEGIFGRWQSPEGSDSLAADVSPCRIHALQAITEPKGFGRGEVKCRVTDIDLCAARRDSNRMRPVDRQRRLPPINPYLLNSQWRRT